MRAFSKKSLGFTLIEMAIVLSVIIVLALGLSLKWPSKSINVNVYAERLVADLRYAQHLAQTTNQRLRVNFASGSYTLTLTDGTTAVKFASGNSNAVTLPVGMTITLPPTNLPSNYVVFDALGRPYTTNTTPGTLLTSTAVITLTQSGQTHTVSILANSGTIQ